LRAVATGPSFGSFALDIQGGIRVGGGNRPAFRVGGTGVITINSPLTNENPSALIFVTQINPDPMNFPAPFPYYITYDFAAQRWVIVSDETRPLSYNVLVINQQ
ncbi:MAG: hypothetical protein P5686_25830, partial [Limnospira sp. PMC 1254.20]|uniref:hypothetical protein n=1 Tax=Limnospira sp. PMC 1254.20 TaxID=2981052 RepID=UPI0028E179D0